MNQTIEFGAAVSHAAAGSLRAAVTTILGLMLVLMAPARADDRFVGRWRLDEGFQVQEYTFRSDGRYRLDTHSTDPAFDLEFVEGGRYAVEGGQVRLRPYEYFGESAEVAYFYRVDGSTLGLTKVDSEVTREFQAVAGSREEVLAGERAAKDLVGNWHRRWAASGTEEILFRPGGYYVVTQTTDDPNLPPDIRRGRYEVDGTRLWLRPYSGVASEVEVDFHAGTLWLIRSEEFSGDARVYDLEPGSRETVRAKATEADAFRARPDWHVGVWEVRDPFLNVDIQFRPDGYYRAVHATAGLEGTVRGRYVLEPGRLGLAPFPGQDLYARSFGEFGKRPAIRTLDYYDGELLFIDTEALSQAVWVARKRAGSEAGIFASVRAAQAERARADWHVGEWEVADSLGRMKFTFRPDRRYIVQASENGEIRRVERGRFALSTSKLTLAPYAGQGPARGFAVDYYEGELVLAGDGARLVLARKVDGSEAEVVEKTRRPSALNGERGGLLGRWVSNLPGQYAGLVLRDDGEFRIDHCVGGGSGPDFGLYRLDESARRLVLDSRFTPVQTLELDFYGDTMTTYGGLGAPSTYAVRLGTVEADLAASRLADEEREAVDAAWRARVGVGPRNPEGGAIPTAEMPADPNPGRVWGDAQTLTQYRLYRRLIPGWVYFNVLGTIRSVAVVNTREWHFFPNGRVLVRFKNYYAGPLFPTVLADVSDSWGAYRVAGRPGETDILHRYADNAVELETDAGERLDLTLEQGRRHLFWEKDYMILQEWASENNPLPCGLPEQSDPRLMNSGVNLATSIEPDPVDEASLMLTGLERSANGGVRLRGTSATAGSVIVERVARFAASIPWEPVQTNQVPAGAFTLSVASGPGDTGFFRLRRSSPE